VTPPGWENAVNALEKDLAKVGMLLVAAATVIGGAVTWVGLQLVEHYHTKHPLSDHNRS
jgi:hypothetical protein